MLAGNGHQSGYEVGARMVFLLVRYEQEANLTDSKRVWQEAKGKEGTAQPLKRTEAIKRNEPCGSILDCMNSG